MSDETKDDKKTKQEQIPDSSADKFFNKIIPKKLIVFTIASIALFIKSIDGTEWTIIASIYLGVNIVGKLIHIKKANKEDNDQDK